ncbi:MAG: hypothetical protein R2780_02445 [Crocinitomicaceae bacterium]
MSLLNTFSALIFFLLFNCISIGQDKLERANELYQNKKYIEAHDLYIQLLAYSPRSPEFNYKFGVCIIYKGGYESIEEPFRYLTYGIENGINDEFLNLHKAVAFEHVKEYEKAIEYYTLFINSTDKKTVKELKIKKKIKQCKKHLKG